MIDEKTMTDIEEYLMKTRIDEVIVQLDTDKKNLEKRIKKAVIEIKSYIRLYREFGIQSDCEDDVIGNLNFAIKILTGGNNERYKI